MPINIKYNSFSVCLQYKIYIDFVGEPTRNRCDDR